MQVAESLRREIFIVKEIKNYRTYSALRSQVRFFLLTIHASWLVAMCERLFDGLADECCRAGIGDLYHYKVAYAVVLLVEDHGLVLLCASAELFT